MRDNVLDVTPLPMVWRLLGWLEANTEIVSLFKGTDYLCSLSRACFKNLHGLLGDSMVFVGGACEAEAAIRRAGMTGACGKLDLCGQPARALI